LRNSFEKTKLLLENRVTLLYLVPGACGLYGKKAG